MKIGVMAYNAACNFGANLQLLSTVSYLKNKGYDYHVINWLPSDLEGLYEKKIDTIQKNIHKTFRKKYYNETRRCYTSEDVAKVIDDYCLDAVIIGSDAIAQHHPFLSRIVFPSRHLISFPRYPSDRMFPNPYWGEFINFTTKKIPIAVLSASSQNSNYELFSSSICDEMKKYVDNYSYLSVRDRWTQKMYSYISKGELIPPITPDPVFGFNYNVKDLPLEHTIRQKFNLPANYFLFGLFNNYKLSKSWLDSFKRLAKREGYECVALAFPEGIRFDHPFDYKVECPLDPIDWYSIIKYSKGYIGHNMHPIVVALHNSVPFFSFDNYGVSKMRFFVNEQSSKIYDILKTADFLNYRVCDENIFKKAPLPYSVLKKVLSFDKDKCAAFAVSYYEKYCNMMNDIEFQIKKR